MRSSRAGHYPILLPALTCLAMLLPAASAVAAPTTSSQVTDAVTQTNVKVIGEAPSMAMGNLYQTAGWSTGVRFNPDEPNPCDLLTTVPGSLSDCVSVAD